MPYPTIFPASCLVELQLLNREFCECGTIRGLLVGFVMVHLITPGPTQWYAQLLSFNSEIDYTTLVSVFSRNGLLQIPGWQYMVLCFIHIHGNATR